MADSSERDYSTVLTVIVCDLGLTIIEVSQLLNDKPAVSI